MSDEIKQLIDDLSSNDMSTRRYAVEDLGDLGDPRAVEPLTEILSNPSAAMREAAVDALKLIGGEHTVAAIIPKLRSENTSLRNAVSEILQSIGEPAVPHLEHLLDDDDNKDIRKFAVDILAIIGSPSSEAVFIRALADRDVNVAGAAAEALGQVGTESCVSHLTESLKANAWIRCSVAKSLGMIGGPDAIKTLRTLIEQDDDPVVVFSVTEALAEIADESACKVLSTLTEHKNSMLAKIANDALRRIEEGMSKNNSLELQAEGKQVVCE